MADRVFINRCYEYIATICGETYTITANPIIGKGGNILLLNPPNDPDNECLSAISWQLGLVYIEDYIGPGQSAWVMYDYDNNLLFYIESSDPLNFPLDPLSSWTIVPDSDGELFTEFQIVENNCPPLTCGCSVIFTGEKEGVDPIVTASEVGTFNGKSIYFVEVGGTTGNLAIYWSVVNNRWQIDYWGNQYVYPEPTPMAFLNSNSDCPEGDWENGLETPTWVSEIVTFITNCGGVNDGYEPLPIDQYCCSTIAFYGGDDTIQLEMNLSDQTWVDVFPSGVFPTYSFSWASADYAIRFNGINQTWELWLVSNPSPILIGFTFPNLVGDLCPESSISDWFLTAYGYTQIGKIENSIAFTILQCGDVDVPEDVTEIEEDCKAYESCKNKNLLSKSAMALSKDIASLSKREVFGFKCDDAWENIFMRSLIIDALSCLPYGTYSEEEERCLIGKLTDKCNC